MADTLGSLCDKLTIVKLKQWHSNEASRLESLNEQEKRLIFEIDQFVRSAHKGEIPAEWLTFPANKVYADSGERANDVTGDIGQIFSQLAGVNCALWHEQEKLYDFEKVPVPEKNNVVKQLALLNLERNRCIDGIDRRFRSLVEGARSNLTRKK
jgi:hypothetical protein